MNTSESGQRQPGSDEGAPAGVPDPQPPLEPALAWSIRPAADDDLDAIMALETGIFGTDAWSRRAMQTELGNPNCVYLVAVRRLPMEEEVVAYAGLLAAPDAGEADIQTIAVAPAARRGGIGRALMRALMEMAAGRGARELFLEVRADNPSAQRLYGELGFDRIGVRTAYYQPDGVDAIVMRYRLGAER